MFIIFEKLKHSTKPKNIGAEAYVPKKCLFFM